MKAKVYKAMKFPIVGQWHFVFCLQPSWWKHNGSTFQFGFFKLISLPPEGEMIQKKNYKGFWIKWDVEFPIFGFTANIDDSKITPRHVKEMVKNIVDSK